ncbi:sigma-54 interaction domain-containing protein [Brevibacillus sp. SYSU BS000544]|uniref:sigma-54 interaction domain-containing protein n=1 Tax=Brevibacillus sp. SYSU BS000544 TaxID=3416443 RepID=UPI003CE5004E
MSTKDYLEPTEILKVAMEGAHECIVVTDAKGYIVLMNKAYRQFIGVEDVVGKHVTDVIENTRMHLIAETGKPEIADIQKINGRQMIANRVPIYKDDKIVAVLGTVIFQDVKHLQSLASSVEQLKQELDYYKGELRSKFGAVYRFEEIVGTSPVIQNIIQMAKRVAKSDTTVLITGESGTGKELFAHAIHAASYRAMGPFIRINCAAIPDTLLESELFGYDEGAFTGASRKGKKGRFELAHHGTILLDEIGDMPLSLQAKLLRVLQEKEVERVGGTRPIALDVRVIASTNRNLKQQVIEGKFREDLYYRLHVVSIPIPPLRDRIEDIPLLANNLLSQLVSSTGMVVENIEDEAWDTLYSYNWPGNIRELRNVLERALHLMEDGTLRKEHLLLPVNSKEKKQEMSAPLTLKESLEIAEKEAIQRVLSSVDGNRIEAAKILDISKSGLYAKIEKYGL